LTNRIFDEIKVARNNTLKEKIAKENGLRLTSNILDELSRDRHI